MCISLLFPSIPIPSPMAPFNPHQLSFSEGNPTMVCTFSALPTYHFLPKKRHAPWYGGFLKPSLLLQALLPPVSHILCTCFAHDLCRQCPSATWLRACLNLLPTLPWLDPSAELPIPNPFQNIFTSPHSLSGTKCSFSELVGCYNSSFIICLHQKIVFYLRTTSPSFLSLYPLNTVPGQQEILTDLYTCWTSSDGSLEFFSCIEKYRF